MNDAAPADPDTSTDGPITSGSDPALDGLGYADAMAELDAILHELERGDVDLDRLSGQVRRAADLVRFCRGRLDDTRTEVTRIVTDLDDEADARLDSGSGGRTDDRTTP